MTRAWPDSTSAPPKRSSEKVKSEILQSFGSSLAQVEMTYGEGKPIAAAAAAGAATPPRPRRSRLRRFAGGREYELDIQHDGFQQHADRPPRSSRPCSPGCSKRPRSPIRPRGSRSRGAARCCRRRAGAQPGPSSSSAPTSSPTSPRTQLEQLKKALADDPDLCSSASRISAAPSPAETRTLALIATVASWVIIIVYLWWRFRSFTYGLAAVLAVVHDVLITLGAIAVSYWLAKVPGLNTFLQIDQFKIDLPIVAAFLTLIGFSVNDTIVIFDRIREIKGKTPHLTNKMVNDALNQTLSRTILTSFTAWLVVVILYFFGGEGLHGFAFALVVGFLSGTYSTIYIATPILIDWVATKPEPRQGRQATGGGAVIGDCVTGQFCSRPL